MVYSSCHYAFELKNSSDIQIKNETQITTTTTTKYCRFLCVSFKNFIFIFGAIKYYFIAIFYVFSSPFCILFWMIVFGLLFHFNIWMYISFVFIDIFLWFRRNRDNQIHTKHTNTLRYWNKIKILKCCCCCGGGGGGGIFMRAL